MMRRSERRGERRSEHRRALPPLAPILARVRLSRDCGLGRTDTLDVEPSDALRARVLEVCRVHSAALLDELTRSRPHIEWEIDVNTTQLRLGRPLGELLARDECHWPAHQLAAGGEHMADLCPVYYRRRGAQQRTWRIFLELRALHYAPPMDRRSSDSSSAPTDAEPAPSWAQELLLQMNALRAQLLGPSARVGGAEPSTLDQLRLELDNERALNVVLRSHLEQHAEVEYRLSCMNSLAKALRAENADLRVRIDALVAERRELLER